MQEQSKNGNYFRAMEYWSKVPATVDGVLGGFGHVSEIDIKGSEMFLSSLFALPNGPPKTLALDCGAGIGRISKFLLTPKFESVDVVEPDQKFLSSLHEFVGENSPKIGTLYNKGLQDFCPDKKYAVIWNQWVLGHLNDEDLINYLSRCRDSLVPNGIIVIKENVTSSGLREIDEIDSSVTRPIKDFLDIFTKSQLKRIKQCKQNNFPEGIYPVYMFALQPSCAIPEANRT